MDPDNLPLRHIQRIILQDLFLVIGKRDMFRLCSSK